MYANKLRIFFKGRIRKSQQQGCIICDLGLPTEMNKLPQHQNLYLWSDVLPCFTHITC